MFDLEKVQTLNELEMLVYHYVLEHLHQIPQQTIRQLATSCHVSTSTILRFCNKMGYAGFSELKYAVKEEAKQTQTFENFKPRNLLRNASSSNPNDCSSTSRCLYWHWY